MAGGAWPLEPITCARLSFDSSKGFDFSVERSGDEIVSITIVNDPGVTLTESEDEIRERQLADLAKVIPLNGTWGANVFFHKGWSVISTVVSGTLDVDIYLLSDKSNVEGHDPPRSLFAQFPRGQAELNWVGELSLSTLSTSILFCPAFDPVSPELLNVPLDYLDR